MADLTERVKRRMRRMHDYSACFKDSPRGSLTDAGARVMADMARYCGAYDSTVKLTMTRQVDPIASAVAEGRRQAYLYLLKNTRLDPEAILSTMEDAEK